MPKLKIAEDEKAKPYNFFETAFGGWGGGSNHNCEMKLGNLSRESFPLKALQVKIKEGTR